MDHRCLPMEEQVENLSNLSVSVVNHGVCWPSFNS